MNSWPRLTSAILIFLGLICAPRILAQDSAAPRTQAANPIQNSDGNTCLYPVRQHGDWGYIDRTGKLVVPAQFYSASTFHDGMAFVQLFSALDNHARPIERLVLIDISGGTIASHVFRSALPFSEGLAIAAGVE